MPRPPRRVVTVPIDHEWSEADLQREVLNLCKMYGLLAYHTHDSRRSQPGYPDLTIVGPRGVLFVELKNATRQLEPEQEQWRDALQAAGQQWRLWRPVDFFSRAIAAELSMLCRPRPAAAVIPSPWIGPTYGVSRNRSLYETRPGDPAVLGLPDVRELADFEPTTGHRHDCIPALRPEHCECAAQLYALVARGGEPPRVPNYCGPRCAEGHTYQWASCQLAAPPPDNRPAGGCPGCGATLGGAIGHMAGCRLAGR